MGWSFETPLIGEFNVRNCLSVIIAAEAWGVELTAIKEALATFQSVKRRMQVRGLRSGRYSDRRLCTSPDSR